MSRTVIHALLENLIDYAGLFPPAKLDMAPAVEEFARQRRSKHAWMLGRFVVPVGRLRELEAAAEPHWAVAEGAPWGLSVLVPGDLAEARQRIDAFDARHRGRAVVEAIERQVATAEDVAATLETFPGVEVYLEIPHQDDPSPLMAALSAHGARAKIRSGGVTAEAFPTVAEVARFIVSAGQAGIGFKATAGLHHPLRGEYRLTYEPDSPDGTMHGFLNVFLAAAWVDRDGMGQKDVEALLSERDPEAIKWADAISWRGHTLDADGIAAARKRFGSSYGSCSFQEPVSDLQGLGIL
ncbi:MAG: hypothetical protein AAF560_33760 [Acidobacteriota bacterium]